ncbi:MAG TPA: hypothetical protein VKS00_06615, partial [Candidatus Acidoferrales bacterium]|nr:hypothetical protein [Candidatus Acidoferrales bacterium]
MFSRNYFPALVFELVKSLFGLAQRCGLNPPLDLQAAALSIEGRAVPDYGALFNFLVGERTQRNCLCPVLGSPVFPVPFPPLFAVG